MTRGIKKYIRLTRHCPLVDKLCNVTFSKFPQTYNTSTHRRHKNTLLKLFLPLSHEAVDRRQVVPRAEQEKGETDHDEQASQVHEGVLRDEPPEAESSEVHRDVLTLGEEKQKHVVASNKGVDPENYIEIVKERQRENHEHTCVR